jgi:serine/threonine-protein kinase 24/25/MST4
VIAIKVLNLDTEEDDVDDIQREIALLSQLTHARSQNITPYYGSFLNDTKLWIIMDYAAGGSVRTIVRSIQFGRGGN